MNRNQFIDKLAKKLSNLSEQELKQTIDYYYEIISDKINDGMTEDEAIDSLGSIDEIASSILSDNFILKNDKASNKNKKENNWKGITIGATAIIWIPILIVLIGAAIGIYVSLWAIVISFGATSLATGIGTLVSILGIIDICTGAVGSGLTWISMGIGSLGLCFIFYTITIYSGKFMIYITKKIFTPKKRGEKHEN